MRRLVTVLTALLLATAAAAGAGDDVKWERSAEIAYVALASDGSAAPTAYEEEVEIYSVGWTPILGNTEIDFIEATYYGWGLHCSRLKGAVADGKYSEAAFFYEVEKSKDVFRNFIIFYVTISAYEQPDTNLADPSRWTIYLEQGDERLAPLLTKMDETGPAALLFIKKYEREVSGYEVKLFHRGTYKIVFTNPYGEPPRENLRLVVKGEKARRGFEWRFKE